VRQQSGVQRHLAACGLLKFFDFPLIWSQDFLLQYLIAMWSTDLQCFIVRGQQLTFSVVEDVYFLMGLPFCGMALPTDPQLSGDERVGDLVASPLHRAEPDVGFSH
jgi:hypothetical protein